MKIGIIGAGGHAKVVADIARFLKYDEMSDICGNKFINVDADVGMKYISINR